MAPLTTPSQQGDSATGSIATPNGTKYFILQCREKLNEQHYTQLSGQSIVVLERLEDAEYLCRCDAGLTAPNRLSFVHKLVPYPTSMVIHPHLKNKVDKEKSLLEADVTRTNVAVVLHKHADTSAQQLSTDVMAKSDAELIDIEGVVVRFSVSLKYLEEIASIDSVRAIEQVHSVEFETVLARQLIGCDNPIIKNLDYRGTGQVIGIADSGFDKGSKTDVHAAFDKRVIDLVPIAPRTDTKDTIGHGTHVAGCALGENYFGQADNLNSMCGSAPGSKLFLQSIDPTAASPKLVSVLTQEYDIATHARAQIRSNSWTTADSTTIQSGYGLTNAQLVDQVMFENRDIFICWSGGNKGLNIMDKGNQQVGAQAAAKNCLSVGSSTSLRPCSEKGKYEPAKAPWPTAFVGEFSSHGPTTNGRLKPDVVAPGMCVLSARSRELSATTSTAIDTNGGAIANKDYCFMTGTSMAAPIAAGCAAALREACLRNKHSESSPEPSGALIKALIINGAVDLEGGTARMIASDGTLKDFAISRAPNPVQGYGRVDLARSLIPAIADAKDANANYIDHTGLAAGTHQLQQITIPDGEATLTITLAYSDAPGATLQSEVTFSVTAGAESPIGPDPPTNMAYRDPPVYTKNNVMRLVRKTGAKPLPPGPANINVVVDAVAPGKTVQPFALVWWIEKVS